MKLNQWQFLLLSLFSKYIATTTSASLNYRKHSFFLVHCISSYMLVMVLSSLMNPTEQCLQSLLKNYQNTWWNSNYTWNTHEMQFVWFDLDQNYVRVRFVVEVKLLHHYWFIFIPFIFFSSWKLFLLKGENKICRIFLCIEETTTCENHSRLHFVRASNSVLYNAGHVKEIYPSDVITSFHT